MIKYLIQRVLLGIMTLLTVATVTFFLMQSVPGDPLRQEKNVPESVRRNLEVKYGLDKPVLEQYLIYMKRMFLQGDFGISFKQENRSVNDIIASHFWVSALLGLMALTFAVIFGPILGVIAAAESQPMARLFSYGRSGMRDFHSQLRLGVLTSVFRCASFRAFAGRGVGRSRHPYTSFVKPRDDCYGELGAPNAQLDA
jgi:ABC-type microcin C transport system permease subunit YejB